MEKSTNYNFNLPNSASDEIADINDISDNFRIIDEKLKVDQTFSEISEKPQSGKAVAEANKQYAEDTTNDIKSYANITFANALKGSKSGSAILIDDVSPVSHNMGVKISSNTVTDLTAVKVSRCGKNLFDVSQVETITYDEQLTNNKDGTLTVNTYGAGITLLKSICPALKVGDTCTFTFTTTGAQIIYLSGANIIWNNGKSLTITEDMLNSQVLFYCKKVDGVEYETVISDIQIELGSTATDYEPYMTPTEYTSTADGTVDGVSSLYPNTTLTTDTDGVIIDCEYNRDINKAFAELQAAIISSGGNV